MGNPLDPRAIESNDPAARTSAALAELDRRVKVLERQTAFGGLALGIHTVLVSGNSYMEGGLPGGPPNNDRRDRFTLLAAQKLGAAEHTLAKDGAVLYRSSDTGGWRAFLKRIKPYRADGITVNKPANAGDWMHSAGGELAWLGRNLNDLILLGVGNLNPFLEAYRSEIVRCRTCALYDVSDAGWTFTNCAAQSADSGSSDGPFRVPNASGAYGEFTLPSHFPGGIVHIGLITGAGVLGGPYTITVDGFTAATGTTGATVMATFTYPHVKRFFVPAGSHVIRVTMGAPSVPGGSGGFPPAINWLGVEALEPTPVVTFGSHRLTAAGATANGVNNADIVTQTNAIKALCAEFTDGLVQCFDMDLTTQQQAININPTDQVHPSRRGHSLLARDLAAFSVNMGLLPARRRLKTRYRVVGDPDGYSGASFSSSDWANNVLGFDPLQFRREADGDVRLDGAVTKQTAAGGGVNYVVTTLPEDVRPDTTKLRKGHATTAAGVQTIVYILIGADGTVTVAPGAGVALPGGANTLIWFDGITWKAAK